MNQNSGGAGILGLLGLAAAFLFLREFFPSLAKLFLFLGGAAALGVAVLVAVVIFFAFRKPKKTAQQQISEQVAATLKTGRTQLMDLRRLVMKIKNPDIRKVSDDICTRIDQILRTLKEKPDEVSSVGRFFHYYLPTFQSILTKYTRLEANGVPAVDTAAKTLSCLKDMEKAMEKQYLNLFESDKLDLSVEMVVLSQIFKQDGLLADDYQIPEASVSAQPAAEDAAPVLELATEDFEPFADEQKKDEGITLTL